MTTPYEFCIRCRKRVDNPRSGLTMDKLFEGEKRIEGYFCPDCGRPTETIHPGAWKPTAELAWIRMCLPLLPIVAFICLLATAALAITMNWSNDDLRENASTLWLFNGGIAAFCVWLLVKFKRKRIVGQRDTEQQEEQTVDFLKNLED